MSTTLSHFSLHERMHYWLTYLSSQRRLSRHTVLAYHNDVKHFLGFLCTHLGITIETKTFDILTLRDCRAWLASRYSGFDPKSNARAIASVKNFWRYLLKHHAIESEVFFLLHTPKIKKALPRPLTHAQTTVVLENIHSMANKNWVGLRDRALVTLLYGTGLRISEALSLKKSDIIRDTVTICGKGNKQRQVPLLPEVRACLKAYIEACPYSMEKQPIFLGVKGKCLHASAAALILRTFRRLYDLPETLTPHALRHTCASHLMNISNDLRGVQTLLGHASLSSTQVYTALDTQKLLETYQKTHPRR